MIVDISKRETVKKKFLRQFPVQDHPHQMEPGPINDNINILWKKIRELTGYIGKDPGLVDLIYDNSEDIDNIENNITNIDNSITNITNNIGVEKRFYAYNGGGGNNIGKNLKDLTLTTEVRKDSPVYVFNSGDAEVEINETDDYEIVAEAGFDLNEGDILELRLSVDDGLGYKKVNGAFAFCGI